MQEITDKIRNNAMVSYALFIINLSFLKSKNSNINNDFVKSHTKSAIFIHIGFLINILILIFFNFGDIYSIFGYSLNDIFAIGVFLFLSFLLILGVYNAYNKKYFSIGKSLNFKKDYKILDLTNDGKFSEKDKLTFILSLIPFIGYIIYPKYKNNKLIQDNIKLNSIITFIIILLYASGNDNKANILFLLYIIFIVFYGFYAFIQNELIHINGCFIPNSEQIKIFTYSFKTYLKNYFTNSKEFKDFKIVYKLEKAKIEEKQKEKQDFLNKKSDFKLNKYLIYIPILNFITLFNLDSKQKQHIINGVIISIIFILILVLDYLNLFSYKYILLLLFPIFFGIGEIKN